MKSNSFLFRLKNLLRRTRLDRERLEEMEFHLAMEAEKNERLGMDPATARRQAQAVFGAVESHREALREGGGFPILEYFISDLRLALRTLRRSPLLACVIVLTLAIGIAATSSIFSAVHEVLIRPLPYSEPDRLAVVTSRHQERDIQGANVSYLNFRSWQEQSQVFESLGVYTEWSGTLSGGELPMRLSGAAISSEVLTVLGVEPWLGRGFKAGDDEPGGSRVAILGHGLWRQHFGARETVVGEIAVLEGEPHTILGVMPAGFRFPYEAEIWVPLVPGERHEQRAARFLLGAIGRLDADVTVASAQADLESICARLALSFPDANNGWDASVTLLLNNVVGPVRPALLILQAAAMLVLLVVCGNVAALLLARGLGRRQEFAMRTALGAGRRRLRALLLTESLVLAFLGMFASLPLLWLTMSQLRSSLVTRLGVISSLEINATILGFSLGMALLATLFFGWLPAVAASRVEANSMSETRVGSGRWTRRLRQGFVVAQMAMVVVLLAGSTLLIRSIHAMQSIDSGFNPSGILSAHIGFPDADYPDRESRDQELQSILERLVALPGIEKAAAAQGLPFSGWNAHYFYQVDGEPTPQPGEEQSVHAQAVTADLHRLLGVQVLKGRWLRDSDGDSQAVALVNESFVERHFSAVDPLGKRFRLGNTTWHTIVGVVADYRHFDLTSPMTPAVYLPWSRWAPRGATLVLKSRRDLEGLIPELRRTLADIAPNLPPDRIEPLRDAVLRESFNARLVRDLLTCFAVVAMMLALIGVYGVITYSASMRRRELGIRVALGATPGILTREMVKQGIQLAAFGIGLGLLAAMALSGFLSSLLFEVGAHDPITFMTVTLLALGLSSLATWLPARRAARENPVQAIRND